MNGRVIFMLEEPSMKAFLEGFLPRFFPELDFTCVPHGGKSDLEKSIPRKLRAFREPGVRFVVLRDNDGADCRVVKQRLVELCRQGGRPDALVRIVCQELEAWYLGDPEALIQVFERDAKLMKNKFRGWSHPDQVSAPSRVFEQQLPEFTKNGAARAMGQRLHPDRNRSPSFQAFVTGLSNLLAQPG